MADITETIKRLLNPARINFKYINELIAFAESDFSNDNFISPDLLSQFAETAKRYVGYRAAVVHYISDNAGNTTDTAPLEIITRLEDINAFYESLIGRTGPRLQYHDIPSQDTYAAAFDIAQAARGAVRGFGNVYFINCAPRKKQAGKKKRNGGEPIYAGMLPNGAIIAGTGEDILTHFKDLIEAGQLNVYKTRVQTNGSQFRSRDIFPYVAQAIGWHIGQPHINRQWHQGLEIEKRDNILFGLNWVDRKNRLALEEIPDLQNKGAIIQRRDIHNNAKTALRHDEIKKTFRAYQDVVVYARGGEAIRAKIARHSFDKQPGTTVVSAGSSGQWRDVNGKVMSPFAEIFTVADEAIPKLGVTDKSLRQGAEIHIIPARLLDEAKNRLFNHQPHSDTSVARALVEKNLVNGLDYQPLRRKLASVRRRDAREGLLEKKAA